MHCTFAKTGRQGDVCTRCGAALPIDVRLPLYWPCKGPGKGRGKTPRTGASPRRSPRPPRRGLGTALERLLARIGLTESRYRHLKYWLGLSEKCGCQARKRKLDEWGWWIGHRVGAPLRWLQRRAARS
jgi:hypothetical protein